MKRFSTRCFRRTEGALALLLAGALAASGCVTRGTYRTVVEERDQLTEARARLEQRVKLLEASNESLGKERVSLIDEMEDLRQQREQLDHDVQKLRRVEAELNQNLSAREQELASRQEEIERLHGTYKGLVEDLESEVASGQIQIEQLREGLSLNLSQDVLFPSGSARLNMAGESVMWKVAARLKTNQYDVEVQGYTDNVPLRPGARWPSNWELAAARAAEVVRLLEKRGVDASRLRVVSYGQERPVASNDTPEGRARNRRIEIRLTPPAQGGADEPVAAGP